MGDDKSENNEVMWYEVYHDLAKELAKLDTKESQKEFYEKCMNDDKFRKEHNWTNVLKEKGHWNNTIGPLAKWGFYHKKEVKEQYSVESFDPMQIFASFNGFGMKEESRIKKINIYFRLLGSEKYYSEEKKEIDFTGCPSPMMLALVFMREPEQIDILWKAFINAMKSKKEANIDKEDKIDFKEIKKCHGVSIEIFTVLLFWIDSRNFLPLDKNTLALFETNNKKIKYDTWEKYIAFLTEKDRPRPTDTYRIIARMAWKCTNELNDYKDDLAKFGITKCPSKSLKIIAIKPLGECNPKFLKGLKENQIYLFDKSYTIDTAMEKVEYKKENDIQLFNQDDLQININAIVGGNGTGKSTLVELLLAVINNVNFINNQSEIDAEYNKEFNRFLSKLKKITWNNIPRVSILKEWQYQYNKFCKKSKKKLKKKENRFYCFPIKKKNCISYIEDLGVELIFEDLHIYKIEIYKDNIESDKEVQLFKYQDEKKVWDKIDKLHQKQFFYNILVNYSIHSLDSSQNNWIEPHFYNDCDTNIVIEPFRKNGNINIQEEEKRVKTRLIVNLLEPETDNKDGYSFRQLTKLYRADMLVSKKNNKIYKPCDIREEEKFYKIKDISEIIKTRINDNSQYKRIEQAMPKNFFSDIVLGNGVRFSQLSSGEKQKIYSINSIVYHIQRLDKKKYKHINLILDEIELYFHPELQRTYINDILEAIKKVGTENILGINITFITHSPFILSDIPESKILFLEKESNDANAKTVPNKTDVKTFGANIHNLLNSSFFMENGLMGEFAKKKIQDIIDFFNEKKSMKEISMEKEQILKIIESIGEPFLKSKLLDMYNRRFIDDHKIREQKRIDEQIRILQEKREQLDD